MKQLMQLAMAVLMLVIISVIIGVGVMLTSNLAANFCDSANVNLACSGNTTGLSSAGDIQYSALANGSNAISSFGGWLPTVAIIIVAVVVISLLIYGFSSFFGKNKA